MLYCNIILHYHVILYMADIYNLYCNGKSPAKTLLMRLRPPRVRTQSPYPLLFITSQGFGEAHTSKISLSFYPIGCMRCYFSTSGSSIHETHTHHIRHNLQLFILSMANLYCSIILPLYRFVVSVCICS